jgi:hypothetical protein
VSGAPAATGGCLCGAVRYAIHGPLRDVVVCHCVECRRWHGGPCSATAVRDERLRLTADAALRWAPSPRSDAHARRGFCGACGSSLFWKSPSLPTTSIAAGSLDEPTGLRTVGHIYCDEAPDFYALPDDGLPRFARGADSSSVTRVPD